MAMTLVEFSKRKRKAPKHHSLREIPVLGCDCFECYYLKNGKKLNKEIEKHPIAMPRKVRGT